MKEGLAPKVTKVYHSIPSGAVIFKLLTLELIKQKMTKCGIYTKYFTLPDISSLSPQDKLNLDSDLKFYIENPNLPIENLCSNLTNYKPRNDTQLEAFKSAKKL